MNELSWHHWLLLLFQQLQRWINILKTIAPSTKISLACAQWWTEEMANGAYRPSIQSEKLSLALHFWWKVCLCLDPKTFFFNFFNQNMGANMQIKIIFSRTKMNFFDQESKICACLWCIYLLSFFGHPFGKLPLQFLAVSVPASFNSRLIDIQRFLLLHCKQWQQYGRQGGAVAILPAVG